MDKLLPPPNGSPEEIQAWNAMMDTMVTFIKASTNLMNTITNKVRPSAKAIGGGRGATGPDPMGGCEPECEACQPKPPCGICGKDTKVPAPAASAARVPSAKAPLAPKAEEPAEAAAADPESPEEPSENPEAPTENPEAPSETDDTLKPPEKAASEPAAISSGQVVEAAASPEGGGDKKCTCAAIRAQRLADEKKDRCSCSRKGRPKIVEDPIEEEDEEEAPEIMCGCGATEGNTDALMKDMVDKLAHAQQEISKLQEEMARLYRMDASKRIGPHGGPNPAALYREIMKESDVPLQRPMRQRFPVCIPCDEPNGRGIPFGAGAPDMPSAPRTMMRPAPMQQQYSSQAGRSSSPQYYTPPQPLCRRPPRGPPSPETYGRSYDPGPGAEPNPDYWSRLGEYGGSLPPSQKQMVTCPSFKSPAQESPPRRVVVCGPPPSRSPHEGCNPNNCRLEGG